MKIRTSLLGVSALLTLTACAPRAPRADVPDAPLRAPASLRVRLTDAGGTAIHRVSLEEYVAAAALSEFAPAGGGAAMVEEMFEVQSVISRTYAVAHLGRHAREGFDLCSTTHCQLFEPGRLRASRWADAARAAAARTAAAILWYGASPAEALFHADCGGHTGDAAAVWGGPALPYLRGVADDGPAAGAHATWRYEAPSEAVRRALNADARTAVGATLEAIEVTERDAAGRASLIRLRGRQQRIVRAQLVREVLSRGFGPRAIRSTRVEIRRHGDTFAFDGRGFGHGVGLCQAGALARIRAGADSRAVLQTYYPGTRLVRLAGR